MLNTRTHAFLGLTVVVVLAICGVADACTVTLNIVGDYVAKGSEDEAVAMDITVAGTAEGKITLGVDYAGTGRVAIWNENRTATLDLEEYEADVTDCPIRLWVQGVATSSAVGDVTVWAILKVGGQSQDVDTDTVTVVDVQLTECESDWLPKGGDEDEDNTTTLTGTIYPSQLTGIIKFTLYDVSDEPGYCMNRPATVPGSGEDSDAWKDLQFQDPQSGFTISGSNKDVATKTSAANSAPVTVKSFDCASYGKIKAEAQIGGTWYLAHVVGGTAQYATVPRDEDGNDIGDGWAHNTGGKNDDDEHSVNNGYDGDGLTRYEEYRGVDTDDDGAVALAERTNPGRKDLFVQGKDFTEALPFAWGNGFNEAEITVHEFKGTIGSEDRNIDVLVVTLKDQGGHIWRRGDPLPDGRRFWLWSTKGQSTVGDATTYGNPEVNKKATNYYFDDKPHKDGQTWTAVGQWNGAANGVLDPVNPVRVEDTNDNGVLNDNEKDGATSPPTDDGDAFFDGDYPVVKAGGPWDFAQDLSPMDIDNDGKVELPLDNQVPVDPDDEYTRALVVRHSITHEMVHGVGRQGHCNDPTCLMYEISNNWKRDGHICTTCRGAIRIHNN